MCLREQYIIARRKLKKEIKRSKARCWTGLLEEVESDPWGMAYKIVTHKLRLVMRTQGLDDPEWVKKIISHLFPTRDKWLRVKPESYCFDEENLFTKDELLEAARKLNPNKAPGLDGIPNVMIKIVAT